MCPLVKVFLLYVQILFWFLFVLEFNFYTYVKIVSHAGIHIGIFHASWRTRRCSSLGSEASSADRKISTQARFVILGQEASSYCLCKFGTRSPVFVRFLSWGGLISERRSRPLDPAVWLTEATYYIGSVSLTIWLSCFFLVCLLFLNLLASRFAGFFFFVGFVGCCRPRCDASSVVVVQFIRVELLVKAFIMFLCFSLSDTVAMYGQSMMILWYVVLIFLARYFHVVLLPCMFHGIIEEKRFCPLKLFILNCDINVLIDIRWI